MALIDCPECQNKISNRAPACPRCGFPLAATAAPCEEEDGDAEEILFEASPSMLHNHPLLFILCILLAPVLIGFIALFVWWLRCRRRLLIVTNKRTTLRIGLLARSTNEIRHCDVCDLSICQTLGERLRGVGTLEISSAAEDDGDIVIAGIRDPQGVAELIREYQG